MQTSRTPIKQQHSNINLNLNINNKPSNTKNTVLYKSECEILIEVWRQGKIELTDTVLYLTYQIDESNNEIEKIEIELKYIKLYSKEELLKMRSFHEKYILALYFSNKNFNLILSLKDLIHFEFLYDKLSVLIIDIEKCISRSNTLDTSVYNLNTNKENSRNSLNKNFQNSTPSKNLNASSVRPCQLNKQQQFNLIKNSNITPNKEGKEGKSLHSKKNSIAFGCNIKENPSSACKQKVTKSKKGMNMNINDISSGNINNNNKSPCNKNKQYPINDHVIQSNLHNNQSQVYQRLIDNTSINAYNTNMKNFSKSSVNGIIQNIPYDSKISNFNKNINFSHMNKDTTKDNRIGLKDNINIFSEEDLILTKQDQDETIGELIRDLNLMKKMNNFKDNSNQAMYQPSNHQLPSNLYLNSYINSKEIDKDIVINYINPDGNYKKNNQTQLPAAKSLKASIDNDTSNSNMNINTKESKEMKSKHELIRSLSEKIDNNEELIFDSFILKLSLKENQLKKEDLGSIYKSLQRSFAKSQILSEMIAILSRRFLVKSIDKTLLEMRKTEKNYLPIKQQKSIELCIIDIFNIFLENSETSNDFYLKILPSYLCEVFEIDYILDIKRNISIPCLFVIMQFHHKIYFFDNTDINFSLEKPFLTQDIKYISIKNTIKWFNSKANHSNQDGKDGREVEFHNNNINLNPMTSIANINKVISSNIQKENKENTNFYSNFYQQQNLNEISFSYINRFSYRNLEIKESIEGFIVKNKNFCRKEDESRLDLFKFINSLISIKDYEMALFICDQYSQKFSETLFLNPFLYLILSEIYSEFISIELGNNFFNKSVDLINWMYGNDKSPLLIDAYFSYSNILFKHIRNKKLHVNEEIHEENHDNDEVYIGLISVYLDKTINIVIEIFGSEHEKVIKPQLLKLLVESFYLKYRISISLLDELYVNFEVLFDKFNRKGLFVEEHLFVNLLIDHLEKYISDNKLKDCDDDNESLYGKLSVMVNRLYMRMNRIKSLINIK